MKSKTKRFFLIDALLIVVILVYIFVAKTPEEVSGLIIDDTTYNTVNLSWNKSENANGYYIYRSSNGEKFEYVDSTVETSYKDTDLTTGTTYTYMVKPHNGIKKSEGDKTEATPNLDTPKIEGNISEGKVELSIAGVDGAQGYKVYRDDKEIDTIVIEESAELVETSEKIIESMSEETSAEAAEPTTEEITEDAESSEETTENSKESAETSEEIVYVDNNAETDTNYIYEVKAYRETAESEASNAIDLTLVSAGKISIEASGTDMTLKWDSDYASYKLYQNDELLTETSDTTYTIPAKEGTYSFKLVGYNEDMQSPETLQTFKVSEVPMDNQGAINAAVEWAVNIANDNSFAYGVGKRAHKFGCYFCGNSLKIKGSSKVNGHSYAKTYCCNPFVSAAYAHGAGDKAMLRACQSGHGIGMTVKSYTRYGNWKYMGHPAYKDLRKGDVLVKKSHVAMYIGNGKYVQAGGEGWGANTIAVSDFSAKKYGSFSFVMRYTGTGSGTMFKAEEIENPTEPAAPEIPEE